MLFFLFFHEIRKSVCLIVKCVLVEEIKEICQEYYDRVYVCEGQKWDLEREVRKRDYEVQYKKPFVESEPEKPRAEQNIQKLGKKAPNLCFRSN